MYISTQVTANAPDAIRKIVQQTGVFSDIEVQTAGELAEEVLNGKDDSYLFQFAYDEQHKLLGYTCYGEIPMSPYRFDLYWIAVSPQSQGSGIAQLLLQCTHEHIAILGGKHVYAETSSTAHYNSARKFYIKQGYTEVARIPSFYKDNDDKVIYAYYI